MHLRVIWKFNATFAVIKTVDSIDREIISFDYAIKNILRDKANFDILSGFLNELLIKPVNVEEILESEGNI